MSTQMVSQGAELSFIENTYHSCDYCSKGNGNDIVITSPNRRRHLCTNCMIQALDNALRGITPPVLYEPHKKPYVSNGLPDVIDAEVEQLKV